MSDNEEFDEIISNQPSSEEAETEESEELAHIWEAVQHLWPHFYPGYLIKGILLAEYLDPEDGKVLRFITSPEVTPWEMLGMLESARLDARSLSYESTSLPSFDEDDGEDNQ